ncbi:MAG: hypothetical protein ACKOQ3_00140 [Novosphingobium sp.]
MPTQVDRTLAITIFPTLVWHPDGSIGATFAYQQTGSVPNMPNRVDPVTGNIRLNNMPSNANYNDNVDITITMDDSRSFLADGTTHVPLRFANAGEGNPPNDVGFCWFINNVPPGGTKDTTEIHIQGMSTSRLNDKQVFINDDTADGDIVYTFCMGMVLAPPAPNGYYITIDPIVSGKGVGGHPI